MINVKQASVLLQRSSIYWNQCNHNFTNVTCHHAICYPLGDNTESADLLSIVKQTDICFDSYRRSICIIPYCLVLWKRPSLNVYVFHYYPTKPTVHLSAQKHVWTVDVGYMYQEMAGSCRLPIYVYNILLRCVYKVILTHIRLLTYGSGR